MSKKESNLGIGEITTIRNILMGEQISEMEEKFEQVFSSLRNQEHMLTSKITDLEKKYNDRIQQLEKALMEKIIELEELQGKNLKEIQSQFEEQAKSDKKQLAGIFEDLSKKISY
jgi:HPt (histidine-containing phosphotransfer) domain-containing protein